MHRLQELQQGFARVPGRILRAFHHIVPFQRGQGDARDVRDAERLREMAVARHNAFEHPPVIVHQVHFVHCQHDMLDAQQGYQVGVPPRLRDDPCAGVHEDDRQVCRRAAGNHVAGVLLMSRRVSDDEFPPVGREIAVSHVDGDALLAFRLQPVEQEGIINVVARVAITLRVAFQRVELVFIQFLAVIQQAPDER